jgi:2,3-bisphosphoglycerate-independent phosphoglycerate mutase
MNGRRDKPFPGEDQVHIPSPKVATYDKQPEMSLPEVNERLLAELDKDNYDVVIVNYANGDMVGHTGDMDAAVKACEAVDKATKDLVEKVQEKNGTIFITADHGNCDIMQGEYRTSHTLSKVRFIACQQSVSLRENMSLANIKPTLMGALDISDETERESLVKNN